MSIFKKTFETNRLLLRPLENNDCESFYAMNNNPNVNRFLRNPILTKIDTEKYIAKIQKEYTQNAIGRYAVILKENNAFIGFSGLKYRQTEENGFSNFYDIGYRFSENYWHKGYATEAALFWIHYGFSEMNLKTIFAAAEDENEASNKLLKKLQFQLVNQYYTNSVLHNWYQITKENYDEYYL